MKKIKKELGKLRDGTNLRIIVFSKNLDLKLNN